MYTETENQFDIYTLTVCGEEREIVVWSGEAAINEVWIDNISLPLLIEYFPATRSARLIENGSGCGTFAKASPLGNGAGKSVRFDNLAKCYYLEPSFIEWRGDAPEIKTQLERHCCYTTAFWIVRLEHYVKGATFGGRTLCIAEGNMYYVDLDAPVKQESHRGSGGRKYRVTWNSGESVITNDLWHAGRIPDYFGMPDNCKVEAE